MGNIHPYDSEALPGWDRRSVKNGEIDHYYGEQQKLIHQNTSPAPTINISLLCSAIWGAEAQVMPVSAKAAALVFSCQE
jgi:hypothetical protein